MRAALAGASAPDGLARDIYVTDGRITGIEPAGAIPSGWEVTDCHGLWALPGLVDLWAHLPARVEAWREDEESLGAAALAGGYATVCAVTGEFRAEALRPRRNAIVNLVPVAAATHDGRLAELDALREAGAVAAHAPSVDAGLMRRVLEYSPLPVASDAADASLAGAGVAHESPLTAFLGLAGIPAEAETVAVARDLLLLRGFGGRLHFTHLSTAGAVEAVRRAKDAGLPVTAAVSIYNLLLTEEAVTRYDTAARLTPPLRGEADRQALIEGVRDGTIDAIVSNHTACAAEDKEVPFAEAVPGAVALEVVLPAALSVLPAEVAVAALTERAARCFGLEAGRLAVGSRADITLFDPETEWTVTPAAFQSRGHDTPIAGQRLRGRVAARALHKNAVNSIITPAGGA